MKTLTNEQLNPQADSNFEWTMGREKVPWLWKYITGGRSQSWILSGPFPVGVPLSSALPCLPSHDGQTTSMYLQMT